MRTVHESLNIYLVRHGQTEGNIQRSLYLEKADHAIRLTPLGVEQAQSAGRFLAERLGEEHTAAPKRFGRVRVWFSPYYRARESADHILHQFAKSIEVTSGLVTEYPDSVFLTWRASVDRLIRHLHGSRGTGYFRQANPCRNSVCRPSSACATSASRRSRRTASGR
jgi:phosphohistidine phosphatase SixA